MASEDPALSDRLISRIQELISSEDTKAKLGDTKGQNVTLFLGNSKAGKSTLVNHALGNPLRGEAVSRRRYKVTLVSGTQGPAVGVSAATFSTWSTTSSLGMLVEAPGLNNNIDIAQDVANAFLLKEMLINAKSAKIVIVCDINDITSDNINHFINLMDVIDSVVPESESFKKGVMIIFTKDNENTTKVELCETIQEKILDQPRITVSGRGLLQFFVDNQNHVAITKTPSTGDTIKPEDKLFGGWIKTLQNDLLPVPKETLSETSLGLSSKTRSSMLNARVVHLKQLEDKLSSVEVSFKELLNRRDGHIVSAAQGRTKLSELDKLYQRLTNLANSSSDKSAPETLGDLNELLPGTVYEYVLDEIRTCSKSLKFIENLLQMSHNSIAEAVRNSISAMRAHLSQHSTGIRLKVHNLSEKETQRELQEREENLRKDHEGRWKEPRPGTEEERVSVPKEEDRKVNKLTIGVLGGDTTKDKADEYPTVNKSDKTNSEKEIDALQRQVNINNRKLHELQNEQNTYLGVMKTATKLHKMFTYQ